MVDVKLPHPLLQIAFMPIILMDQIQVVYRHE